MCGFGCWDDYSVLTNTTINYCRYKKINDGKHIKSITTKDADAAIIIAARIWADMWILRIYVRQAPLFPAQASLVA